MVASRLKPVFEAAFWMLFFSTYCGGGLNNVRAFRELGFYLVTGTELKDWIRIQKEILELEKGPKE